MFARPGQAKEDVEAVFADVFEIAVKALFRRYPFQDMAWNSDAFTFGIDGQKPDLIMRFFPIKVGRNEVVAAHHYCLEL